MTPLKSLSVLAVLGLTGLTQCLADGLPTKQPNLIYIWRESVKPGRAVEHAKNEAGFVAALEKAKSKGYGLALISETGPDEAWYLNPWDSNAAMAADRKQIEKAPGGFTEFDRLERIDAEYLTGLKKFMVAARPDLSVGDYPDLSKARFFQITVFRLRPGHESQFEEAAKAYIAALKRAAVKTSGRVYQVAAGLPAPTFLLFSSLEDYAQFDQLAADGIATWSAATPDERAAMQKFKNEAVLEEEVNRFRVDPVQSYVPKEVRDKDPDFWSPK